MKVVIISKDNTDYTREVTDYLRDFHHQTGRDIEVMDPETPAGVDFCRTYDILQFPTLLALSDDGHLLYSWKGTPLPTISEVSYYA